MSRGERTPSKDNQSIAADRAAKYVDINIPGNWREAKNRTNHRRHRIGWRPLGAAPKGLIVHGVKRRFGRQRARGEYHYSDTPRRLYQRPPASSMRSMRASPTSSPSKALTVPTGPRSRFCYSPSATIPWWPVFTFATPKMQRAQLNRRPDEHRSHNQQHRRGQIRDDFGQIPGSRCAPMQAAPRLA